MVLSSFLRMFQHLPAGVTEIVVVLLYALASRAVAETCVGEGVAPSINRRDVRSRSQVSSEIALISRTRLPSLPFLVACSCSRNRERLMYPKFELRGESNARRNSSQLFSNP